MGVGAYCEPKITFFVNECKSSSSAGTWKNCNFLEESQFTEISQFTETSQFTEISQFAESSQFSKISQFNESSQVIEISQFAENSQLTAKSLIFIRRCLYSAFPNVIHVFEMIFR